MEQQPSYASHRQVLFLLYDFYFIPCNFGWFFFNEIPVCGVKLFHKKFNFQFPEGKFQVLMDAKKHL